MWHGRTPGSCTATRPDVDVAYTGLDLSADALGHARRKHPATPFLQADVLADDSVLGDYDYVVMNGVFHWRGDLSTDQMERYWRTLLATVYEHCRMGLAFNVMSHHVDWYREDLFHLPFDTMAEFVTKHLSRHLVIERTTASTSTPRISIASPSRRRSMAAPGPSVES